MIDESENIEIVLCPSCLADNLPTFDFCDNCGCPIGRFVNLDPLKRIYSQGWLYRRSASGRIPPIVLLGIWLIFGSDLLMSALFLAPIRSSEGVARDLWVWSTLPFAVLYAAILYRVTRNYLRWRNCDKPDEDICDKT